MLSTKRTVVFIDGSNLYHRFDELNIRTKSYNYRALCQWLSCGTDLQSIKYYVGAIRARGNDIKAEKMRERQREFFDFLRSPPQSVQIYTGNLQNIAGKYREKGVDVQIAVDLVAGAFLNEYDTAFLISSDTDLIPAVKKVQTTGKKVRYIGFNHKPIRALRLVANEYFLLTEKHVSKFC